MTETRTVVLNRDCPARLVPVGDKVTLPANSFVNIKQALGGTYTVTYQGNMYRIDGTDADALGFEPLELSFDPPEDNRVREEDVLKALESVYDPEIPVSVVQLGLIYDWQIDEHNNVNIKMTLTAPGCGMGDVLVSDIKYRVGKVPNVRDVNVELVFDPPWDRSMIAEEAQLELGLF